MHLRIFSILLVVGELAVGCGPAADRQETAQAALADIEQWQHDRMADLQRPDGWLSLVGLYWLKEGANRFGSAPDNDLVFPDKAPPHLGVFYLEDAAVRMEAAPGVDVRYNDTPVTTLTMDAGGETAEVIPEWGSLSWFVIQRDHGLGIRLRDREAPARAAFDGIDAFPVDLAWRLQGRFERYDPPKTIMVPTVLGGVSQNIVPGAAAFALNGQTYRLDVIGEPADSAFFVIFGDQTNKKETYSGGRYVWVDAPNEHGMMVIDFNKSYNPPCVFTPYATCPLPPPQNRLAIRIEAGEKVFSSSLMD